MKTGKVCNSVDRAQMDWSELCEDEKVAKRHKNKSQILTEKAIFNENLCPMRFFFEANFVIA